MRAHDGHPAMSRPTAEGSATATLAAKLAALPIISNVQCRNPLRLPCRESRSKVIDDATIMPSTETGRRAAVHDVSPYRRTSRNMCLYDTIAAITASTTTLRVVVKRIARSGAVNLDSAMADQPST
jgi:hypothetical protein